MADREALARAEGLFEKAETLKRQVDAEVRALNEAVALGEEMMGLVQELAREAAEHITHLGQARQAGRVLERQALGILRGLLRGGAILSEERLRHELHAPVIAVVALGPARRARAEPPPLPDFRVPTEEELQQVPVISLQHNLAAWDALAEEFLNVQEDLEAELEEAERLLRESRETTNTPSRDQVPTRQTAARLAEPQPE